MFLNESCHGFGAVARLILAHSVLNVAHSSVLLNLCDERIKARAFSLTSVRINFPCKAGMPDHRFSG